MSALLYRARDSTPTVLAPVVAQVWRDGARQARLARYLRTAVDIVAYDDQLARQAGELLAATGLSDAIDAGVALLAHRVGGVVVTSDRDDLELLTGALADPPRVVMV